MPHETRVAKTPITVCRRAPRRARWRARRHPPLRYSRAWRIVAGDERRMGTAHNARPVPRAVRRRRLPRCWNSTDSTSLHLALVAAVSMRLVVEGDACGRVRTRSGLQFRRAAAPPTTARAVRYAAKWPGNEPVLPISLKAFPRINQARSAPSPNFRMRRDPGPVQSRWAELDCVTRMPLSPVTKLGPNEVL
jgi:hypothetical protein